MTEATAFAYAAARMQARHGRRPDRAAWNHMERIGDFGHLVQTVRGTALAPWVADFDARTDVHRIERGLRERFRQEVDEVAGWVPRNWRDAISWLRWVPDLAALAHARHQRPAWPWLTEDPVVRALSGRPERGRAGGAPLARIAAARDDRTTLEHWYRAWRAAWPRAPGRADTPLADAERRLGALIDRRRLRSGDPDALEVPLQRLFRRHAREPAGALAYIGLLHLQFVRLRGLLLRGRLFRTGD